MTYRNLRNAAFAALLCGVSQVAQAAEPAHSLAEDARVFGARESVRSVSISPSGRKLLFISAAPGAASVLQVIDLESKARSVLLKSNGRPENLYWCEFGSDEQIVCKFGGTDKIGAVVAGFSRMIVVPAKGGKLKELGQASNFYNPVLRQYDGDILDWLPDRPGSVLMQRSYIPERNRAGSHLRDTREGLSVDRVDLATLDSTIVESPRREAGGYMTDGRGNVRLMTIVETANDETLTGKLRYKFRRAGSKDWQPFGEYDERTRTGTYPIAVESQSDSALVLRKLNGRDALYRTRLDGSGASELVAANPVVDIDDVVRVGRGQRVIGYTYATEEREVVYFDPEFKGLSSALARALPSQPAVNFEGASADGSKIVVLASSATDPGKYYLLDKPTKRLDEVAPIRPELEGRKLAEMRAVQVPGPDGVQIPAYLTLPPGSSGKGLPAVVLPHGGPEARDEMGFDWLAQFLAARGYAVIQPNYRGSSGFGQEWQGQSGFREWRKAIADISASARYLANQGIADPQRLAILGWSYGGYAALQSAAVEPDLYKAAVAIAPVTDLLLLKSERDNFTSWKLEHERIGSGPELTEGSPTRRADAIKAPVLLVHGDVDANVDISHSDKMLNALRGAGKTADIIRFKGLNHQLDDSDARTQMLTRIGSFLDARIGH